MPPGAFNAPTSTAIASKPQVVLIEESFSIDILADERDVEDILFSQYPMAQQLTSVGSAAKWNSNSHQKIHRHSGGDIIRAC